MSHQGNWDQVKGFFRRRTQTVNQNYRNASKTTDTQVDAGAQTVFEMQKRMRSLNLHMGSLTNSFAQSVGILSAIQEDMESLGQCNLEGVANAAKCMELAVRDLRSKLDNFSGAISKDVDTRLSFDKSCDGLRVLLDERRQKLLEFDFFRNKLAGLRANPPSDSTRIPRNQERCDEWSRAYDEANERVKSMCNQLQSNGARLATNTTQMVTTETGKYYDESARTARAILLGQGMQQAVASAMASAQASAAVAGANLSAQGAAAAQQVAQQAAMIQQATPAMNKVPGPSPSSAGGGGDAANASFNEVQPTRSSTSFNRGAGGGGDDPFKV